MKRLTIALLLLAANASAATLQWDGPNTTGSGPALGGTGNWDTTTTNWFNGTSHVAWTNPSDAVFSAIPTATATATLNSVPITFNSITFGVNGYTIASTGPTLGPTGSASITTSSGISAAITATTNGTTLHVLGPGTLSISHADISGTTFIDGGNLVVPAGGLFSQVPNGTLFVGDTISNSTILVDGSSNGRTAIIGNTPTSTNNTVTVTGAGIFGYTGTIEVGENSSNNTLLIENGGLAEVTNVNTGSFISGGTAGNTQNNVVVTGTNSALHTTRTFTIGVAGNNNSLSVTEGGHVVVINSSETSVATIGLDNGADFNSATISDPGSLWTINGNLQVGNNGSNNSFSVLNGAVTNISSTNPNFGNMFIGGNVANLANGSNNTMTISGGGQVTVSGNGSIGDNTTSNNNNVTITDPGSLWSITGTLDVGNFGSNNSLTVLNEGEVTAGAISIALNGGSSGTLFIGTGGTPGIVNTPIISGGGGQGAVVFNHNANPYTFSVPMGGNLTVEQVGTGTTLLTGINTYLGNTLITNGTLQAGGVDVFSPNATVNIQAPGTLNLGGFNQITSSVTNNGLLTFGGVPTVTLQVNGTYTQGNGGNLIDTIDAAGDSDLINTTGAVSLNGTLTVDSHEGFSLFTQYHLIHSNTSVSGIFNHVASNSLLKPVVIYDSQDVYLFLQSNLTFAALTHNEREVAHQWDSITNPTEDQLAVLTVLVNLPINQIPRALDDMAGEQYIYLTQLDRQSNEAFSRRIFNALRNGCVDPCDPTYGWLQVGGGQYFVQKDINSPGLDTVNLDVSLGTFSIVRERLYLGIGGNYELNRLHFHQGGKPYWNTLQGAVYGAFMGDDSYLFIDIITGYSWGNFTRPIDFGTVHRRAKSKPSLTQAMGYAELGCNLCVNCLDIQPYIGAEYGHYSQNRFTEHGANSLNLRLRTKTTNTADSYVGAHISSDYQRLAFNLDLAWQHRFKHANILTTAQFDQFGTPFSIFGVRLGNEGFVGALGCLFSATDGLDLYAELSGECWQRFYTYAANVGFSLLF